MKKEKIRVLVIDDDETIGDVIKNTLKCHYDVHVSLSGKEGINTFKLYRPPIVILDIFLGDMCGFDVLSKIKSLYPPSQVIVITGMGNKEAIVKSIRSGACDFLEKPFEIALLKHTVNSCIEKWELTQENKKYQDYLQDLVAEKTQNLEASMKDLKNLLRKAVEGLVKTIEARDPYTAGHQERVMILAVKIAEKLGVCEKSMECVSMAALLHDIGKIYVPSELLVKPSKLSNNEFNLIKDHSVAGYDILAEIPFPYDVAEIVLQHHERIDGSGYPFGLKEGQITTCAKIIGVADVVEAMSSHRPYRASLGADRAIEEITEFKGTRYCPTIVDACMEVINDNNGNLRKIFDCGDI